MEETSPHFPWRNCLPALVVCLGPFFFGAAMIFTSIIDKVAMTTYLCYNLTDYPQCSETPNDKTIGTSWLMAIKALTPAGIVVGCLLVPLLIRVLHQSRIKFLAISAACGIVSTAVMFGIRKSLVWVLCGRALMGIVVGFVSTVSPMVLVESVAHEWRDFFGSLNQLFIVFAQVLLSFCAGAIKVGDGGAGDTVGGDLTRINFILGFIIATQVLHFALIWCVRETGDVEVHASLANELIPSICSSKVVPGLVVGVVMMFAQQFSGINAITFNVSGLMGTPRGGAFDPNFAGGVVTAAQGIACFVGGSAIKKMGRKFIWISSCIGGAVGMLVFAFVQWQGAMLENGGGPVPRGEPNYHKWSACRWTQIVMMFVYQFAFGLGLAPIPWTVVVFWVPRTVLDKAQTIVSCSSAAFAFIVVMAWDQWLKTPDSMARADRERVQAEHIRDACLLFCGVCIVGAIFGAFVVGKGGEGAKENEQRDGPTVQQADSMTSLTAGSEPAAPVV